ncbi:Uncharacterised protein [uncultured archaeon]|nr:Uncharacterised protein [uncultured archaeon]
MFFKEPPATVDDLALQSGFAPKTGVFGALKGIFSRNQRAPITRLQLADQLRAHNKKLVFFIDEAHLAAPGMYMEFKYLLDDVPNLRIVFCALGKENFPDSLVQLIGEHNVLTRTGFSQREMRGIIEHRITAVGGKGLRPFDDALLSRILTGQNLLTPRYVFDEINEYLAAMATQRSAALSRVPKEYRHNDFVVSAVSHAAEIEQKGTSDALQMGNAENYETHAGTDSLAATGKKALKGKHLARKALGAHAEPQNEQESAPVSGFSRPRAQMTTSHASWWSSLSPSQSQILTLLLQNEAGLSLADLMKQTGLAQNTAFNALYQLRGEDEAEKKRKPDVPFPLVHTQAKKVGGRKRNLYTVSPKIHNLFTLH